MKFRFPDKSNKWITEETIEIKRYNNLIKEYETKGFFGKMFSEDPASHEAKINSKKGVIENINQKKKLTQER